MSSFPGKKPPFLGGDRPARTGISPGPECRASLHGGLEQIALSTLLTIMDLERRSGLLVIRRGDELARLWLSGGRVVRARLDGVTRRTGKPAVYEVLAWQHGRFELASAEGLAVDEIKTPTNHLLMEAARRMDEASMPLPG
jgi:hypothetical protein